MKQKLISIVLVLAFALSIMTAGAGIVNATGNSEMDEAVANFAESAPCTVHNWVHMIFNYASSLTKEALGNLILEKMGLTDEKYQINIDDEGFEELSNAYGGAGNYTSTPTVVLNISVTDTELNETTEEISLTFIIKKYLDNTKPWFTICKEDIPFTDLKQEWYYDSVAYVYANELMNGISKSKFEPTTSMTRAMFVTVLGRLAGVDEDGPSDTFSDTKKDSYYSAYVAWAADNNIVEGFTGNTFRPDEAITREQMAAIISRYVAFENITLPELEEEPEAFNDVDQIHSYATEHVEALRITGIVKGDQNGNFNPRNNLSRAESATILTRLDRIISE